MKGGFKMSLPKYYKEKIYDKDMRHDVSVFLQQQSDFKRLLLEKTVLIRNPSFSLDMARNSIDYSKLNTKFDSRITEVL